MDWAADALHYRLTQLANDPNSKLYKQLNPIELSLNRFLDELQRLGLDRVFFTPKQISPGSLQSLNRSLVFVYETAPVFGTIIGAGELASGQSLGFTVDSQFTLGSGQRFITGVSLAGTAVVAVVAKFGGKYVVKVLNKSQADEILAIRSGVSLKWPKHHPFPMYLGGAADQTLKKIPRNLHYQFHSSLDKWMDGKYARAHSAKAFIDIDKAQVIKDLTKFYKTADGGAYAKYLDDFLQAVTESGF